MAEKILLRIVWDDEKEVTDYCSKNNIEVTKLAHQIFDLQTDDVIEYYRLGKHLGTMKAQRQFD